MNEPRRAPREYVSFAERDRIATWAARRWKRTLPRHLALDDLRQEAHYAICLAHRSYDPLFGKTFAAYARSACIRWLTGYVGKMLAPVSGSTHALLALSLCERVQLEELPSIEDPIEHIWRAEVREVLEGAVGAIGPAEVFLRILAGESSARHEGTDDLPVKRIHALTGRARRSLEESREMWQLWNER
jgi:hypothetical protein